MQQCVVQRSVIERFRCQLYGPRTPRHLLSELHGHSLRFWQKLKRTLFGLGNASQMATNVVLVVLLLVVVLVCYQIFDLLKLFHFASDRN